MTDYEKYRLRTNGTSGKQWKSNLDGHWATPPAPPPPPVSGMYIGCSNIKFDELNVQVTNTDGSKAGGTNSGFSVNRVYASSLPATFPAEPFFAANQTRGIGSAWSWTPGLGSTWWATVNSGSLDATLTTLFNSWPAGVWGTITFGHEPEDNSYDNAAYRTAQARLGSLFHASNIDKTRVKFGIILTGDAYRTGSHVNYYPTDTTNIDFVGIDYYEYWRPDSAPVDPTSGTRYNLRSPAYLAGAAVNYANSIGKPVFVGEHALHPDPAYPISGPDPGPSHARPERFQTTIDYFDGSAVANGTIGFCVYHSKLQPNHGPWWWDAFPNYSNPDDQTATDPDTLQKLRDVLSLHPYVPGT